MKFFIVSDTHFNHPFMLERGHRPENYEKRLIRNLRGILHDNTLLYHLGDICLGNDTKWSNFFGDLPGRKVLIKGNHDGKSDSWYLNHGWDFVAENIIIDRFSYRILLSHAPTYHNPLFDINIHGHSHTTPRHRRKYDIHRHQILVSMEENSYRPMSLKKIINTYEKAKTLNNRKKVAQA